jgi:hypothetical protein
VGKSHQLLWPGLAWKPRLWLGLSGLWLSQPSGRAKAIGTESIWVTLIWDETSLCRLMPSAKTLVTAATDYVLMLLTVLCNFNTVSMFLVFHMSSVLLTVFL